LAIHPGENEPVVEGPVLQWLLAPTGWEGFLAETYEVKPLHIQRNRPDYYGDLFSTPDLEEILWSHESEIPSFVRLEKRGSPVSPPVPNGPHRSWLQAAFSDGATVIANSIDAYSLRLAVLCRDVSAAMGGDVTVNAYLSPPHALGFAAHFDTHDTFILQLEGTKTWGVHPGSAIELPLEQQMAGVSAQSVAAAKPEQITLRPGDLLYVPRGVIHETVTHERASLHLTVGLHPIRWVDLMKEAIDLLAESSLPLRRAVRASPDSLEQSGALAAEIVQSLASGEHLRSALSRLRHRFISGLKSLPGDDLEAAALARANQLHPGGQAGQPLSLDDGLRKRPGMICLVIDLPDAVGISFPGLGAHARFATLAASIKAPEMARAAFEFVRDAQAPFFVRELPGAITDNARIVLATRLMQEGLLTRSSVK
jgi:ribosomal protein L16 Arg81 hydroxylase